MAESQKQLSAEHHDQAAAHHHAAAHHTIKRPFFTISGYTRRRRSTQKRLLNTPISRTDIPRQPKVFLSNSLTPPPA